MKRYFLTLTVFALFLGCGRVGDDTANGLSTYSHKSKGGLVLQTVKKSVFVPAENGQFINSGHYRTIIRTSGKPEIYGDIDALEDESNYKLLENGKVKDESTIKVEKSNNAVKSKIMLLLDLSGSIIEDGCGLDTLCGNLVDESNRFVNNIIGKGSFEIAIYYFNSKKEIMPLAHNTEFPTSNEITLTNAINTIKNSDFIEANLRGFNSTNLYGAVKQSSQKVCSWIDCKNESSFEIGSVVVFTDGKDLAEIVTKTNMLSSLEENVQYYTIGIGKGADNKTLIEISGKQHHFEASNDKIESAFTDTFNDILRNSNFYKINYCPATQGGVLKLSVLFEDHEHKIKAKTSEDTIRLNNNIDLRCDL